MLFAKEKSLCGIKQKIIVSAAHGKEHRALNQDGDDVFQFKIDGDIIPSSSREQRCDYLLENQTKTTAYLIELKGSDVNHAVDQIRATIDKFRRILSGYKICPRIVYKNNSHVVYSSKVRLLKKDYVDTRIENERLQDKI